MRRKKSDERGGRDYKLKRRKNKEENSGKVGREEGEGRVIGWQKMNQT